MDQSFDAVVGDRHSREHVADPKGLVQAFIRNLEWRLKQNNVPIKVEAAELLIVTIGDGNNPYRTPIQIRVKRIEKGGEIGWEVEQMSGPAAIPVESGNKVFEIKTDTLGMTNP